MGSIAQLKEEVAKVKTKDDALRKNAAEWGRRKLVNALYLHENYLLVMPGKYAIPEWSEEERREAASYLRNLADKIQKI